MDRRKQQCLLDLVNTTIRRLPDGVRQLIAPDGRPVATWTEDDVDHGREQYLRSHIIKSLLRLTTSRNFAEVQALIRECQKGNMTLEVLEDGNMEFYEGGKRKALVTLPNIDLNILE